MAAHKYTETTIETAFRATIGDPAGNPAQRWTSAECIDYLNRGAAQVVLDIPNSLETKWTTTTANGTRLYVMPNDFIADKRVEYVVTATTDERVLTYLDETEWKAARFPEDKSNTGDPQFYTFQRNLGDTTVTTEQPRCIILEPTPDAANTLRVYGFKLMQALASGGSNVPELALPKLEAIIAYGCHLAATDDNDDARADRFLQRYELQVRKIINYTTEESLSRASSLKPWNMDMDTTPLKPWDRRIV